MAVWALVLLGLFQWVHGGGFQDLAVWGTGLTSLGRLTGLLASSMLLVEILMMARVPWVERTYGQDRLTYLHRLMGFGSFSLMVAHVGLIVLGYNDGELHGLLGTAWDLTTEDPGMLLAVLGTAALCLVVVTSLHAARSSMKYENWHLIHLYAYLGAGLAVPHQLWTGADFLDSPVLTALWWALWGAAMAAVVVFRLAVPWVLSRRLGLRVASVEHPTPGVVTVRMTGRSLNRLRVSAGQYFVWRFGGSEGRSRGIPLSLSEAPDGRELVVSAQIVGRKTARMAQLVPGTRVHVEGPYGRFHDGLRERRKVLFMASGTGIAPVRALLEAADLAPGDGILVYRASDASRLLWAADLEELCRRRGVALYLLPGARQPGASWQARYNHPISDEEALYRIAPDLADRDLFLCGPSPWMDAVRTAAGHLGVPARRIHAERFGL